MTGRYSRCYGVFHATVHAAEIALMVVGEYLPSLLQESTPDRASDRSSRWAAPDRAPESAMDGVEKTPITSQRAASNGVPDSNGSTADVRSRDRLSSLRLALQQDALQLPPHMQELVRACSMRPVQMPTYYGKFPAVQLSDLPGQVFEGDSRSPDSTTAMRRTASPAVITDPRGAPFMVALKVLDFDVGCFERVHGTAALWNIHRRHKLSEDVQFGVAPQDYKDGKPPIIPLRCIFALAEEEMVASTVILLQLSRSATGKTHGIKTSQYTKPNRPSDRERQKLQATMQDWSKKMPATEQFAWALVELFAADGSSPFREGQSLVVDINPLHCQKESYSETSLLDYINDPRRKIHKPIRAKCQVHIQRLPGTTVNPFAAVSDIGLDQTFGAPAIAVGNGVVAQPSPGAAMSPLVHDGIVSERITAITSPPVASGVVTKAPSIPQAVNFRLLLQPIPHARLYNLLYIYPRTFTAKKPCNVFVRIELRDGPGGQPLPAFVTPTGLQTQANTQLNWASRLALFHDEMKLQLPPILTPHHHLLFTFLHVEPPATGFFASKGKNDTCEVGVLGFAAFPLLEEVGEISRLRFTKVDELHNLPVTGRAPYRSLPAADKSLFLEDQSYFSVRMRVVSSLNSCDEALSAVFELYSRYEMANGMKSDESSFERAIRNLTNCPDAILVQYLHPLLSMLLRVVATGQGSLRAAAFGSMLNVLNYHLQRHLDCLGSTEPAGSLPAYPGLSEGWKYLLRNKMAASAVPHTISGMLLALLSKSIWLQLQAETHGEEHDNSVVMLNDSVLQDLKEVFNAIMTQVLEMASMGNANDAQQLNISASLFLVDMLATTEPDQALQLVDLYFNKLTPSMSGLAPALQDLRLHCLKSLVGMDDYVTFITQYDKQSLLVDILLREVLHALSNPVREMQTKAVRLLAHSVTKCEYDSRHQWNEHRALMAAIYFPLINLVSDNISIVENLPPQERREILVSAAFVMRHAREEALRDCWAKSDDQALGFLSMLLAGLKSFEVADQAVETPGAAKPRIEGNLSPGVYDMIAQNKTRSSVDRLSVESVDMSSPTPSSAKSSSSQILRFKRRPAPAAKMWEGNLSTAISLTMLDAFVVFLDTSTATEPTASVLDRCCDLLLEFMHLRQSAEAWLRFVDAFDLFLCKHPSFLMPGKDEGFLLEAAIALFRTGSFASPELRSSGVTGLRLLLKHSVAAFGNTVRLRTILSIALSRLPSVVPFIEPTGSGMQQTPAVRNLWQSINEFADPKSNDDKALYSTQVRSMATTLQNVVTCQATYELEAQSGQASTQGFADGHALADAYFELATALAHVPDLHSEWLRKLSRLHRDQERWAESAMCSMAMFMATHVWTEGKVLAEEGTAWAGDSLATIMRISAARNPSIAPLPKESQGLQSNSATYAAGLRSLHMAASLFLKAELFAPALSLFKVLLPVYEYRRSLPHLIDCHDGCKQVYEAMQQEEEHSGPHPMAAFYRVAFYGACLGALNGQQYVYREPHHVTHRDFVEWMQMVFEAKLGQNKLGIITSGHDVVVDELMPTVGYIQVTPVTPLPAEHSLHTALVPDVDTGLCEFAYETQFSTAGSRDLWSKRTVLRTESSFPSAKARLRVVDTQHTVLPSEMPRMVSR
eukprot:jgi/Chlat1/8276/Chrsp78S07730